jgi:formate hydrogenlyase transcriptional activator
VADKKFREDLFYRLNVFPIHLPPLRERRSDIPLLVTHFIHKHATRMHKRIDSISAETIQVFSERDWPGNIRELENVVERLVILAKGPVLFLPPAELEEFREPAVGDTLDEKEREHIVNVLRETNGVFSGPAGAAHRLGLKRTTLQSMIKRLSIAPLEYQRRPQS